MGRIGTAGRALLCGAALLAARGRPATLAAQAADTVAFASPRGAYVWMKGTVVSTAHSVAGVVAHRLERARPGGPWEKVADVSAVRDARSFFGRLDTATRRAVVRALGQKDEAAAWDYIVRNPGADSLAAILGNDDVRLALGIYGLDPSPRDGETWRYRVSDVDADGAVSRPVVSNAVSFPARASFDPVRVAESLGADSVVVLRWYVGDVGTRAKTVEIWRRAGRSGDFEEVDSVAVSILAADSLLARSEDRDVTPGAMYQYYAVPRDLFFNRGAPSDTVTVYTVPMVGAALPDSIEARGVDTLGIVVTWRVTDPDRIRTVQLFRSLSQDTGYVQIAELPPTAGRFVDAQVTPMTMYYYRLGMTGLRGEVSPRTAAVFGFFRSALAPAPPLAVHADTTAVGFRIAWTPAGDVDLAGYRVYRTDAPVDTLTDSTALRLVSALLPPADTVFVDSAAGAGRQYTWAVRAVSPGGIESGYSNPASASRTAATAFAPPSGVSGYADARGVALAWADMAGSDPLVSGYVVLREDAHGGAGPGAAAGSGADAQGGSAWDTLTARPLGRLENGYRDTTAVRGSWRYAVMAERVDGTRSAPSASVRVSRKPAPPPPPPGFRVRADSAGIVLAWDPMADSAARVRVYRYERGGRPARVAEVGAAELEYVDRDARPGHRYWYYMATVSGGLEGPRSEERTIRR
ncbi:MAG: fibronectin type III domain-containing protein [Candidatus Palauibacterales bacterium]|nr:fibronectin type III domain-containing protein [Candidatus Palauibacterales bacterium]MDP2584695.1 fibronectin type III domain-containing protein [Candidatus Palauibacterales bacterium]